MEVVKKAAFDTHDWLFISGALFIVIGIGLHSVPNALIALGISLLFIPFVEIVSGFARGLSNRS
jgi:hypothetical protein